jgi:hypothetical protein
MRRSANALWATPSALALTARPAAAPEPAQTTDDSVRAAQDGAIDMNALVGVLSDGENGAVGGNAVGPGSEGENDSIGTAQIEPPSVDAPMRVISDGDAPAAEPSQLDPSGGDTSGSGDPDVGGGEDTPGGRGDPSGSGGETPGSVGGVPGPEGLEGDTETLGGESGGDGQGTGGRDLVFGEKRSSGTRPVADSPSGGDGGTGDGDVSAGSVRVLGAQVSSLPVTGLGLLATFVLGLVLIPNGTALRMAGREPR